MTAPTLDPTPIGALLARLHGEPPRELHLQIRPIRGGLEAEGLLHVVARYRDARGRPRTSPLVIKQLRGAAAREAAVYEALVAAHAPELSPRLLGVERPEADRAVLYLEALRPVSRWPWRDAGLAGRVLERLAGLHRTSLTDTSIAALGTWDYEAELQRSAAVTLERLQQCGRDPDLSILSQGLPATRRVVLALAAMRRQLLAFTPFGRAPIHGDLHPGNALMRRQRGHVHPVLLDWGRARIGSPLEDVSSWLQSLGYWEPEARRRHDTLLARYLAACEAAWPPVSTLRAAYWLAGASNALAGALAYHLFIVCDRQAPATRRARAAHSARDWLRVLRRADEYWS